jgi:acetyl-CoA carboxylase biotin carboxyl carrier protein
MELKQIQNLIKFVAKSGASEVKLEMDDVKITIKTGSDESEKTVVQQMPVGMQQQPMQQPVPQQQQQQPAEQQPSSSEQKSKQEDASSGNYVEVKSPIIGTFYRKPGPEKKPFVEVGSQVKEGDVLCTIEAMKLFNDIESEVSGKVVKVLVDDSTPVEFDQPLFLVDPS